MHIQINLFILSAIVFMSCSSGQSQILNSNSGLIEVFGQLYDTSNNQFAKPILTTKSKVWYKDSLIIEEVRSIKIVEDSKRATQEYVLENYRFNNLRTRMVYEYKTFTDSSKIIRVYSLDDSIKIYGGWNFKFKRKLENQSIPTQLTDTIIDHIIYKRVQLENTIKQTPFLMICYFRCDKKGTIFDMDPDLSKLIDCPLVKVFTFSPVKKGTPSLSAINFLSDSLTHGEIQVFNAWEKNIKKYPIK